MVPRLGRMLSLCALTLAVLVPTEVDAAPEDSYDDQEESVGPGEGGVFEEFELDSDQDGISDSVEERTGTDPFERDTDGDGIPDGREDRDGDGVVGPGESDPRVHGLFPGSYPHIPEPMVFDLVRGLGAERDELEVNTLIVVTPSADGVEVGWAPEVEWAFAQGYAVEFELPMVGRDLDALKGAIQGTFPDRHRRFIHGWQAIVEVPFGRSPEITPLYLAGGRPGKGVSLFAMSGVRVYPTATPRESVVGILNPSVFVDLEERLTIGLETNWAVGHRQFEALIMPQIHWQIGRRLRLQIGGGVAAHGRTWMPAVGARVILE